MPELYFRRGNAYFNKGDGDHARTDYDQTIKLKADFSEAYYNRGLVFRKKGDASSAAADFKKVLELTKDADLKKQAEDQLKALGVQP